MKIDIIINAKPKEEVEELTNYFIRGIILEANISKDDIDIKIANGPNGETLIGITAKREF